VCDDCTMAIANNDYNGMGNATETRVRLAVHALAHQGYPVIGEDQGFSWRACDCCKAMAGNRHECSLIGN